MKGSINNDNFLILKASQGNEDSFGLLFDKYSKKIYRFIYYKVSIKEVAEDLTSQCFLKAWEQVYSGIKIKHFQAFCYQIARNLVIDYYRSREKEELPLIYQIEQKDPGKLQFNPDKNLDLQQLEKVLLNLNSEIREIVTLRFIEDLSIKEIAKIVDKSPSNIRVILHRALKELNKYISK
ncbi:sigma-70 family RNA polymerase sigma factor [Patescibacteria group bacterium]|nr:sigma-70 family RNA polymerase sigma factor [Patescibacteria group bacterium]